MSPFDPRLGPPFAALLGKCADNVSPAGRLRWNCVVRNGRPLPVSAAAADDFILLDAAVGTVGDSGLHGLLERNATLDAGAKFALSDRPWRIGLRAEIAVHDDVNLLARLRENLDAFRHCGSQFQAPALSREPASGETAVSEAAVSPGAGALGELLRQTQWAFQERSTGGVSVDLEMRDAFFQALIEERGDGLDASVELVQGAEPPAVSCEALAAFLLCANHSLRLVRARVIRRDAEWVWGFQTRFESQPCPAELDHALAALSVACRAAAREASALLDESVARQYLAVRNLPPTIPEKEN